MLMNVAPKSVSGRVVNTVTSSPPPSTGKRISAPSLRPIQLRCISMMFAGHRPSSSLCPESSSSAYFVMPMNHWSSSFWATGVWSWMKHVPSRFTCSLASTVWHSPHQLSVARLRYASPSRSIHRKKSCSHL